MRSGFDLLDKKWEQVLVKMVAGQQRVVKYYSSTVQVLVKQLYKFRLFKQLL